MDTPQVEAPTLNPKKELPADFLILDTVFVAYKSFLATPPLTSKSGEPTRLLHAFLGSVLAAIQDCRPSGVVLALESPQSKGRRDELYADYKATRKAFPDEFSQSFPALLEFARLMGWDCISAAGEEADDIVASFCTQNPDKRHYIFTTDKDLLSLTANPNVFIYQRKKGKSVLWTAATIKADWGINPEQIPDLLAIDGDAVDNIPGVKGMGSKTAISLLQQYGTLDNILANLSSLAPKHANRLQEGAADLELSRKLVRMNTTCVLPALSGKQPDYQAASDFLLTKDMVKMAERVRKMGGLPV